MLNKDSISGIVMHSDAWFQNRLGKFTSSEFYLLMGAKGISEGGLSYVYRKIGEELTGLPCRREVSTEATEHGNLYEMENLKMFGNKMGLEFMITQKLITPPDSRHSSTPDALIVHSESQDGLCYNVSTVEAKCPMSYDGYIKLWKCKTPMDVKSKEPKYFYQILHQMWVCGALVGYLSVYHPHFKAGQLNIVEFKKIDLLDEFKLLTQRGKEAIEIFESVRNEMLNS